MKNQQILLVNRHPSLAISLPYLRKKVSKVLSHLALNGSSVEITFVTDAFMRKQNQKHMHKKGTTDVLSFPQIAVTHKQRGQVKVFANQFLGDILISLDQAKRQASEQGISLAKEVLFLMIHSILHLVGYDHAKEKDRVAMQRLESKIWGSIYKLK